MANRRACVSNSWLLGPEVHIDDLKIRLLPPEETLWTKLYVLQRDRCDWPDALNMLYVVGPILDWERLLELVEGDAGLLSGLLAAFRWLCPGRSRHVPNWLWNRLGVNGPGTNGGIDAARDYSPERASLLDTRPWFTPMMDDEPRLGEK